MSSVTLTIAERLLLLQLLGKVEGNLVLIRQIRALQQVVGFSEHETEVLEFHYEGPRYMWTEGVVPPLEVAIPPSIHAAIVELLEAESKAKRLTTQQLSLCDKFIPEESGAE